MRVVVDCVSEVPPLFEALVAGDQAKVEAQKDLIFAKEQAADEIKNQLRGHLPKSILMPVDRRDLLEVLAMQDSIADTAQDIAGLLVERKMEVPADMGDTLVALVKPLCRYLRAGRQDHRGAGRTGRDGLSRQGGRPGRGDDGDTQQDRG